MIIWENRRYFRRYIIIEIIVRNTSSHFLVHQALPNAPASASWHHAWGHEWTEMGLDVASEEKGWCPNPFIYVGSCFCCLQVFNLRVWRESLIIHDHSWIQAPPDLRFVGMNSVIEPTQWSGVSTYNYKMCSAQLETLTRKSSCHSPIPPLLNASRRPRDWRSLQLVVLVLVPGQTVQWKVWPKWVSK